jgi:hypothetical protein
VSLLSPSVRIAMTPGRVAVASSRGYQDAAVATPGWAGALEALGSLLAGSGLKGNASVVLSHHFSHVHLLPPPPVVLEPAEMQVWIRDQLMRQFGETYRDWRIVSQAEPPGRPFVASSLEPNALAELEAAIRAASLKPAQVQPWLAVAWNRQRRRFGRGQTWFALAEPDRLTLARVEDGRMRSLRSMLMQGDAVSSLADLLRREALLAGETAPAPLWVASVVPSLNWQGVDAGRTVHPLTSARDALAAMLEY